MAKRIIDCIYENRKLEKCAVKQGERSITYAELWKRSLALADKLRTYTTQCVAINMPNSIEYVISYFAILLCEKTVVPIGAVLSEEEVREILDNTKADILITVKEKQIKEVNCIVWEELECENSILEFDSAGYRLSEVAVIFPTSGTTSKSKYVQLSNENLMQNVEDIMKIHNMSREKNMWDNELVVLPLTASFCNTTQLLVCMYCGMTITLLEGRLAIPKILQVMEADSITYCEMTPTLLNVFALYYSRRATAKSTLKRISCGGETIGKQELKKVQELMPNVEVYLGYGLTEAGPVVATQSATDYLTAGNSVGKLLESFEIRFSELDSQGDYPKGTGEIQIKGPCIMKGYLNEETPSVVDGWLSTGDIGYRNEEGNIFILGRKKNIIISGGRNINAEEIEDALRKKDEIEDARVYGEKSELYGEIVVADVILKKNCNIAEEDIIHHCKTLVAEYKLPKKINFVNVIKRNSSGKIVRY